MTPHAPGAVNVSLRQAYFLRRGKCVPAIVADIPFAPALRRAPLPFGGNRMTSSTGSSFLGTK
jgi:hypothetical protein